MFENVIGFQSRLFRYEYRELRELTTRYVFVIFFLGGGGNPKPTTKGELFVNNAFGPGGDRSGTLCCRRPADGVAASAPAETPV